MIQKIKTYFTEARAEFKHVNWPTRDEAIRLTGIVIFLSIGIALFLGAFDYFFSQGLAYIILQ